MLCHALQGIKTCFDVYGLKMSENTPNVEIINIIVISLINVNINLCLM